MDARLPIDLYVRAHLQQCNLRGVPATIVHRGSPYGTSLLVKLVEGRDAARVLSQTRLADGRLAWLDALGPGAVPEERVDSYIERKLRVDEDLWVLEIQDPKGWHPFTEPVIGDSAA